MLSKFILPLAAGSTLGIGSVLCIHKYIIINSNKEVIDNKEVKSLKLDNYKEIRKVKDDRWNKIENGNTRLEYFDNDKEVGYIDYRSFTGQVGIFYLEPEYRQKGLGTQILLKAMEEMRENKVPNVWAVTTKDHEFWSKVFKGSMSWNKPAHNDTYSITGSGYNMKL